jgi:hypothetical protein
MATPNGPPLTASGAAATIVSLATALPSGIPQGADNAIIRFDVGTARWSETGGSWLTASTGLIVSAADAPFRISNLALFAFVPVGGAAAMQALPYRGYAGPL